MIGIQDFTWVICFIDKETTRHVFANLSDYFKVLAIQLELLSKHTVISLSTAPVRTICAHSESASFFPKSLFHIFQYPAQLVTADVLVQHTNHSDHGG